MIMAIEYLEVDGEPVKRYRLFRTTSMTILTSAKAYDTLAELRKHRWRADRRYKICVGRKWVGICQPKPLRARWTTRFFRCASSNPARRGALLRASAVRAVSLSWGFANAVP